MAEIKLHRSRWRAGGYAARMAPSWFAFVVLLLLAALVLGGALVMVVNFDRNEARKRAAKAAGQPADPDLR